MICSCHSNYLRRNTRTCFYISITHHHKNANQVFRNIRLLLDPVESSSGKCLRREVNQSIEDFRAWNDRQQTNKETGSSRSLEGCVPCLCEMGEELDTGGVDDDALNEEPTYGIISLCIIDQRGEKANLLNDLFPKYMRTGLQNKA